MRSTKVFLVGICFAVHMLHTAPIQADNYFWVAGAGDGLWGISTNWNPAQVPQSGDTAFLTSTDGLARQAIIDDGISPSVSALNIDATNGGSMGLVLSHSTINLTSDYEMIGMVGNGTVTHTAGNNTLTYSLDVASSTGSNGSYNLSGTGILSASDEVIGDYGSGIFSQTGGTNTLTRLTLGYESGSSGRYDLSGAGSLNANFEIIGFNGTGTFTQTGGTNTLRANLVLGSDSGGGTYELSGTGNLLVGTEYIGEYGAGTFIQTGGTNTLTNMLVVGGESGSYGSYTLSGTGNLRTNREGIGLSGTGTFKQTGGTHTITNLLYLGSYSDSSGTYELSGTGNLLVGTEYIGHNGTGIFTQTGGTHTVAGNVTIATNYGSKGTYELQGGTLNTPLVTNNDQFQYSGGNLNVNTFNNNGRFNGIGIINPYNTATVTFINTGTVAPGNSPGSLTIQGNYSQTGNLEMELGGYGQGTEYDFLNIAGSASLAGTLNVSLWNGFIPAVGSVFTILMADEINGEFSSYSLPTGWAWNVEYLDLDDKEIVRLTANAVPIPPTVWIFGSALLGLVGIRRGVGAGFQNKI